MIRVARSESGTGSFTQKSGKRDPVSLKGACLLEGKFSVDDRIKSKSGDEFYLLKIGWSKKEQKAGITKNHPSLKRIRDLGTNVEDEDTLEKPFYPGFLTATFVSKYPFKAESDLGTKDISALAKLNAEAAKQGLAIEVDLLLELFTPEDNPDKTYVNVKKIIFEEKATQEEQTVTVDENDIIPF